MAGLGGGRICFVACVTKEIYIQHELFVQQTITNFKQFTFKWHQQNESKKKVATIHWQPTSSTSTVDLAITKSFNFPFICFCFWANIIKMKCTHPEKLRYLNVIRFTLCYGYLTKDYTN